jgi:hypothetical protein
MSGWCTAAMSRRCCTGTNSWPACCASSSSACSPVTAAAVAAATTGTCAAAATTTTAAATPTPTAAAAAVGEQRAGRCNQECRYRNCNNCRYDDYRKKLGCFGHSDDPLFVCVSASVRATPPALTMIFRSLKIGASAGLHCDTQQAPKRVPPRRSAIGASAVVWRG